MLDDWCYYGKMSAPAAADDLKQSYSRLKIQQTNRNKLK